MTDIVQKEKKKMNLQEISMDEIIDARHSAGKDWVNTCAIHQRYDKGEDEKLKRLMAKIAKEQIPPYGKKSWNRDDLRDAAQASDDWKAYLDEWNTAYKAMLDAINERDSWNTTFEAKRTSLANEREQRR